MATTFVPETSTMPVRREYRMRSEVTAFIPARSGSKRVPNKNVRLLAGHPLIAHTIAAARRSGVFQRVVVSTNSEEYAAIAKEYGAEVVMRPEAYATDTSPDIEWVLHAARQEWEDNHHFLAYSILRPTSPFRSARTISSAWERFQGWPCDSLRAVRQAGEHPGKMWVMGERYMTPVLPYKMKQGDNLVPWHSNQKQALPLVFVQTAGMEFSWARILWDQKSISGDLVMPYILPGFEGLDINDTKDWAYAELLLKAGTVTLEDPTP